MIKQLLEMFALSWVRPACGKRLICNVERHISLYDCIDISIGAGRSAIAQADAWRGPASTRPALIDSVSREKPAGTV